MLLYESLFVVDYGKLTTCYRATTMKGFPRLRLQQDWKTRDLMVIGDKLTKTTLELKLEALLAKEFTTEVEVLAEEFPGTSNTWRISTTFEGRMFNLIMSREQFILIWVSKIQGYGSHFFHLFNQHQIHQKLPTKSFRDGPAKPEISDAGFCAHTRFFACCNKIDIFERS